jgi:hypothetical protein
MIESIDSVAVTESEPGMFEVTATILVGAEDSKQANALVHAAVMRPAQ